MLRTEALTFIRKQDIDRRVRKQESDKIKRGMVNIPRHAKTHKRHESKGFTITEHPRQDPAHRYPLANTANSRFFGQQATQSRRQSMR